MICEKPRASAAREPPRLRGPQSGYPSDRRQVLIAGCFLGWAPRPGSTRCAALTGTSSRRVPAGRSRKWLITSDAVSTSPSAGMCRPSRSGPASVIVMLPVVRLSRWTPCPASGRLKASERLEALTLLPAPPLGTRATGRQTRRPQGCEALLPLFGIPNSMCRLGPPYRSGSPCLHGRSIHGRERGHDRY
jgi:hypothetical protein